MIRRSIPAQCSDQGNRMTRPEARDDRLDSRTKPFSVDSSDRFAATRNEAADD